MVRKKKMKMVKGRRGSTPREKMEGGGSDLLIRKGVGRVWLMKIRVILVI